MKGVRLVIGLACVAAVAIALFTAGPAVAKKTKRPYALVAVGLSECYRGMPGTPQSTPIYDGDFVVLDLCDQLHSDGIQLEESLCERGANWLQVWASDGGRERVKCNGEIYIWEGHFPEQVWVRPLSIHRHQKTRRGKTEHFYPFQCNGPCTAG